MQTYRRLSYTDNLRYTMLEPVWRREREIASSTEKSKDPIVSSRRRVYHTANHHSKMSQYNGI